MDCKQFVKRIPDFLMRDMDYNDLKQFCSHAKSCENCKEELTIQFLVSEGITHLETGDAFDLNKELDSRMREASGLLSLFEGKRKKALSLQFVGLLFLVASVITVAVL